jgi:serine/threonine protein kinase
MSVDASIISPYFTDFEEGSDYTEQAETSECDLITFLAVAQKVQVDILPITWQSARGIIGVGATSTIYEASINSQPSFAFKCIKYQGEGESLKTYNFLTLINEVTALSQLRGHPNILELQGICWDVIADDEVLPVLVLEKAPFGNLYTFLERPVGRDLSIPERLSLSVDIGTAIIHMHSHGMIIRS